MGCALTHSSVKVDTHIDMVSKKIEFPITKEEIHLLKESWDHVIPSWNVIVAKTFQRWLQSYPELRQIFKDLDKDLEHHEIFVAPALLSHADKMKKIVESVLENLEDKQKLISSVIQLGMLHHNAFGAKQMHATAMITGVIQSLYTHCELDIETQNAWSSLLTFLADMLKTGMRIAIKEESDMPLYVSDTS